MTKILLILSLLIVFIKNQNTPHPPCTDSWSPDEYFIDLDKSPLSRWRQVITDKKQYIKALQSDLLQSSPYKYIIPFMRYVVEPFLKLFKNQFLQQVRAIAHFSQVSEATILVLQYMYELGVHKNLKMCTAILVQKEHYVFHSRNLDYDFPELLAKLTVTLHFRKNNRIIYSAVTQAGFTGIHTGIAYNKFAIDLNQRNKASLFDSFLGLISGNKEVLGFIRHVLQKAQSYSEAVKMLKQQKLISPCYLIISGLNGTEGAVITRNKNSVHDIYTLEDAIIQGKSYIVQTNYDRDIPDPQDDQRRIPAQNRMDLQQKNATMQSVLQNIMIQYPTFNSKTLLTTSMSAIKLYLNTTVWYN